MREKGRERENEREREGEGEKGFVCCRSVLVTYHKFVAVMATLF